ncbi:MAG: glycerate kinase [Chloroflexi bacterium]|nr:glycerate kinase [Chloroflexota bacterium]
MKVLFAPDSFKGTLSSVQVARALAAGWQRARPGDEVALAPLADGGEGTLDAIEVAGGWRRRRAPTADPLGRPIEASWLSRDDEAVVELAAASGLSRVAEDERDPIRASTFGTGRLLVAALDEGARRLTLGIGGSATTDGGRGLLEALGATVRGPAPGAADWTGVEVALETLDPRLASVAVRVACDVDNPLLGSRGAAATYAPQKGATPADVSTLDRRNEAWADALERAARRQERDTAGAGAAGGVGFALLCLTDRFGGFALQAGVSLVMAATGFDAALAAADVVVTGEGRIDAQTGFGKTAIGVARRARVAGIPCYAVGGSVNPEGAAALASEGAVTVPVHDRPISLETAIAAGAAPLEIAAERLARRITQGGGPATIAG